MPPGARCEVFGGVLVSTVRPRQRIVCGWYASDTDVPAERASPCASYGPLSQIVYMSIAVMRPSFRNPTFTRARMPGRARPMKCSSSRVMRIITGALAFFESSAGMHMKIDPGILLPKPPPVYSLMITVLDAASAGGTDGPKTQRPTDATVCIVLCVEPCSYSLPFCQYAIAVRVSSG